MFITAARNGGRYVLLGLYKHTVRVGASRVYYRLSGTIDYRLCPNCAWFQLESMIVSKTTLVA